MVLLFGWLADSYMILESPFVFSLIYVWSKLVPDMQMSIYGFPVKSANLPWVLMAMHILMGGGIISDLVGVAAGHSYIYLKEVLPESHGYDLLKTPNFMRSIVGWLNNT